ncbi:MAG: glycosyltransferase family 39 protein [candidate division FCPU426 bacterium]
MEYSQALGLLLLILAALGLRLFHLDFRSLWLDEAYSLRLASASWPGIWQGAALDIHPPLFHFLQALWIRLAGTSEFSLRFPSALYGALLVPVAFGLGRLLAGRAAAWWAALLVAASPYFIELSRQARMPGLLALLSAGSLYFFWRWFETRGRRFALGYWLCTLAALYTHYFSGLALVAEWIFLALAARKNSEGRSLWREWLIMQAALALAYAPWMAAAWHHLSLGGPSWRGTGAGLWEPLHSLYAFMVGTACWTWSDKAAVLAGLALAAGVWLSAGWPRLTENFRALPFRTWLFLGTLLVAPLAMVWVYSQVKINVFDNRYLSVPALACLLLAASQLAGLTGARRLLAGLLIAAAFFVPLRNQYFVYGYYDNWRQAAAWLNERARPGDEVVVYPPWNEAPLAYYLRSGLRIQGLPGRYDPLTGETENYFRVDPQSGPRLQSFFAGKNRFWLVQVNEGEAQALIQDWLDREYELGPRLQLGGINLGEWRQKEP